MATTTVLEPGVPEYPANRLKATRFVGAPITVSGNVGILDQHQITALFCSTRCPGDLILKTYDLARSLREGGVPVIGGFHSPMEQECLRLLLRGQQPVAVCPARSIHNMRLSYDWCEAIRQGRLLLLSPFPENQRRQTAALAALRNEFVAALADAIFIVHAEAGSKTEALGKIALAWGKPVYTFDSRDNTGLISLGVKPLNEETSAARPLTNSMGDYSGLSEVGPKKDL
jgi:predicted Rossmann fold nucleotide-binding protein DprA/Smf involved in DNA uptake